MLWIVLNVVRGMTLERKILCHMLWLVA